MGYNIDHVDGGYHLMLMFLPMSLITSDRRLYQKDIHKLLVCEMFYSVVCVFRKQFKSAWAKDKARATLQKQVSSNMSTYHVLQKDHPFIPILLDRAIATINDKGFLKPVLFLTQCND